MENERNVAEDESILASIDESFTYDGSYERSISMNDLEEIWNGNYVHPEINEIYARLKINDSINQAQNE